MDKDKNLSERLAAYLTLQSAHQVGPVKIKALLSAFSTPENILESSDHEITASAKITSASLKKIRESQKNYQAFLKEASVQIEWLRKYNAKIAFFDDDDFPLPLRNIYDIPLYIYMLGEYTQPDIQSLAIVGTRTPTGYGKKVTETITGSLTDYNFTIISGLARGVDSIAHSTALKKGGRTIAVLGTGLDKIYPAENRNLAIEIIKSGCLITEFAPGTKPDPQNFPRRNRLISGLSRGTLIVESGLKGGSLYTAEFALDQGKDVFAIPGNINSPHSEGTNSLIQRGEAKLVMNTEDILKELNVPVKQPAEKPAPEPQPELNLFESKIFSALSNEPKHIDIIATESGLAITDCLVNLLTLQFKGVVNQLPGKYYTRI